MFTKATSSMAFFHQWDDLDVEDAPPGSLPLPQPQWGAPAAKCYEFVELRSLPNAHHAVLVDSVHLLPSVLHPPQVCSCSGYGGISSKVRRDASAISAARHLTWMPHGQAA